jgi:hypothetical protein
MHLLFVAAILAFAGCSTSAMRSNQGHDAQAPDTSTSDAWSRDSWVAADVFAGEVASAAGEAAAVTGCTSLPVTWLDEPSPMVCSPSASPTACAGNDVGAVVARSSECVQAWAWGLIPDQCLLWPSLDNAQEFVVLKVDDCSYRINVLTLQACADHIQIEHQQYGTCSACDGTRSDLRVLILPRDARPVVAVSKGIIMPPCLPPPPP